MTTNKDLASQIEPFDSFWEAPDDVEKGFGKFYLFYKHNYLKYVPENKDARILNISCGGGYFVELLKKEGYKNVLGIDSEEEKIAIAKQHDLNCRSEEAFPYLENNQEPYDLIFCEQEINHLTKDEIMLFLDLCKTNLKADGILIMHALNGANPIVGAESLAQNFDHHNTFTEYTFRQILEFKGYENIEIYPLNLYVFYKNPLNYILIVMDRFFSLFFRCCFIMYGKKNKIWTKKIGSVCKRGKK